ERLYEDIRTVFYGPFYFQFVDGLFAITGHEVDHAGARWLLLAGWAAGALTAAWLAWRLSRSLLVAAVALAVGFPFLVLFTNEPLPATSPVLLLLAPLLVLLHPLLDRDRRPSTTALAACGALCAGIALVKLNVGAFVLLACAAAFAARFGRPGG